MTWSPADFPALRDEAHFGDRVVSCFHGRPRHLYQMLAETVARFPDREALVMGDIRLSWAELSADVDHVASALAARGVSHGDRIVILMHNGPGFIVTLFAAARLAAIAVPVSVRASAAEVAYVLDDSDARLLVHDGRQRGRLPQHATPSVAVQTLTDDATRQQGPDLGAVKPEEDDAALILYTSGTTGRPKGAMLTHLNIVHAAMYYEAAFRLTEVDRAIAAVPLSHLTGISAMVAAPVRAGTCIVVMEAFKADSFLALAEAERMSYTLMVPAMYNLCLLQPDFAARDLTSWRIGGFGGAAMPEPTIRRLAEALPGLGLANCYGATETVVALLMTPPARTLEKRHCVGAPLPGTQAIVMGEDGIETAAGEPGELWLGGPTIVKGYWGNPVATAASFVGGYWKSGDIGVIDRDGYVRVLDRAKDMINRGGFKIFSAEVESALADHPAVVESAIIARPCPVLGERAHAVVVSRSEVDGQALTDLCSARLADYKTPESYTIRAKPLPRNANGKIDKRALRQEILPTLPVPD